MLSQDHMWTSLNKQNHEDFPHSLSPSDRKCLHRTAVGEPTLPSIRVIHSWCWFITAGEDASSGGECFPRTGMWVELYRHSHGRNCDVKVYGTKFIQNKSWSIAIWTVSYDISQFGGCKCERSSTHIPVLRTPSSSDETPWPRPWMLLKRSVV